MKILNKLFISIFALSLFFNPSLFSEITDHEEVVSIEETVDGFLTTIRCGEETIQVTFPGKKIYTDEENGMKEYSYIDEVEDSFYILHSCPFEQNFGVSPIQQFLPKLLKGNSGAIKAIIEFSLTVGAIDHEDIGSLRKKLNKSKIKTINRSNEQHPEFWVYIKSKDEEDGELQHFLLVFTESNVYFLEKYFFKKTNDSFIKNFKVLYE